MQQLSLSARPRRLDDLIGQSKLITSIRGHIANKRVVKAWMFTGPLGVGKTTIARILAISFQCDHQTEFGNPCKDCYAGMSNFPIYEINCAEKRGVEDMKSALSGSDFGVLEGGSYRVYILDEMQRASVEAQSLALKYLEDSPETTVFILCSTEPHKILDTLRSRCIVYDVPPLEYDDVQLLVEILLKKTKSKLGADRLAGSLRDASISYPRLIAQAVEKYVAGADPDDAARVTGADAIDVKALSKAVFKGEWDTAARLLKAAQTSDIRQLRLGMLKYLRTCLLDESSGARGEAIAKAITSIALLQNAEDLVISAALAAELYRLSEIFSKYKL